MANLRARYRVAIHPDSLPIPGEDLLHCDLGGEAAILDPRTGIYYGLNRVGARIWTHMTRRWTVGQIERELIEEFEVEPGRCRRDLLSLLQRMEDSELVRIAHGTT